jgi:radical SAM protein with 4Fe4S-binding SPASM domain
MEEPLTTSALFSSIMIETYGYCNRTCDFCFNADRFPKRDVGIMDKEIWIKIIDELSTLSRFELTKQILKNLRVEGLPENILKALKPLKYQGFDDKNAFLKAVEKQISKKQTGKYQELILNSAFSYGYTGRISPHFFGEPLLDKRLMQLIGYAKQKCPHAFIQIMSNGDMLTEPLLLKLIEKGVDHIIVTNYDDTQNEELIMLSRKYATHVRYRSYQDLCLTNRAGKIFHLESSKSNSPCFRPSKQMVINWKGNVLLCCQDYCEEYVLGNVRNESLLTIWNSKKFEQYKEMLSKEGGRQKIEICKKCDHSGLIK